MRFICTFLLGFSLLSGLPARGQDEYDAFLQQMRDQNDSDRPFSEDRPQMKLPLPASGRDQNQEQNQEQTLDQTQVSTKPKSRAKLVDNSREFTSELPDGWSSTATPFIKHSVFILRTKEGNQTIFFQLNKGNFKAVESAKEVEETLKKRFQNFKLLSVSRAQLGKFPAVKLISTGDADEQKMKSITYVRPLKRGMTVAIIGSFAEDEKEKETEALDAIFVKVATSVDTYKEVKQAQSVSKIGKHLRLQKPQLPQTQENGVQQN